MVKKIILVLIIVVLFCVGFLFYIKKATSPSQGVFKKDNLTFKVEEGEGLYRVLSRLEERDLISSSFYFKIYNKRHPFKLKKGEYEIIEGSAPLEILKQFEKGVQSFIRVTIPEGLTRLQTLKRLADRDILTVEEGNVLIESSSFAKELGLPTDTLDGFLYPDTYFFQEGYDAKQSLTFMVETALEKIKEVYPYFDELSKEKQKEKIIMASVVEKEYRDPKEAPLMASVFYNRLKKGMPLQSCATVVYILTEIQKKPHPGRVYFRDLEIESPFNTYRNEGLPPYPISNPGEVALNAAFNPAQSDYLFFVVKDSQKGTHIFSSNFADHNKARASYLSGFRSKN